MSKKILVVEDEFIIANDLAIILKKAGYDVCGIAESYEEAMEIVNEHHPDIVLLDIHLKGSLSGIDLAKKLRELNIAFVYLSANSNQSILEQAKATQPYGFMVKPFRERDVLVTLDVARFRHESSLEFSLQRDNILRTNLKQLIDEYRGWEETLLRLTKIIQQVIPFDFLAFGFKSRGELAYNGIGFLRDGFDEYQMIGRDEIMAITGLTISELTTLQVDTRQDVHPVIYDEEAFAQVRSAPTMKRLIADTFEMESHMVFPLYLRNGEIFNFVFFSRMRNAYFSDHLSIAIRHQRSLLQVVESMLSVEPAAPSRKKMTLGSNKTIVFDFIVGKSHRIIKVLDLIARVSPSETSVLILGETGTGKELVARAIHLSSSRHNQPWVAVSCGALPADLIESELFGHERGAFSGANEQKIGKFEQAHGGILFLDEIGELPLALQVKLLRVLQEKEIERLGGKDTIKVDVRIIAATNRNLEKEVGEGRFRLDLYYRLNVFPITLPSLRERKDDIPVLAKHFISVAAKKLNKGNVKMSASMISALQGYDWPGNVRELENTIVQAMIMHNSGELSLARELDAHMDVKANQTEKDYITAALRKSRGRIRGDGGAAELLNIKPTTLESRIARLGIRKEDFL